MPTDIIDNFPMHLQQRINAFAQLGTFLSQFNRSGIIKKEDIPHNDLFFDGFKHQIKLAREHNGWFTEDNVLFAIEGWAAILQESKLQEWLSVYDFSKVNPQIVAIIMAGNIPLVGFHDFLSVLISGHQVIAKLSSNDQQLLPFIAKYLEYVHPDFKGKITFTQEKLESYDAVIATGSDNTARYFEYYFGSKPHIIRKNRNSIAILTGNETAAQLSSLGEDIFRYYGLGCRNVSKLFVPKSYDFDAFFNAMYAWKEIIEQAKYANNYDYNKAIYLMSLFDIVENGFLMLKEDDNYASPISTVFYEYYDDQAMLLQKLNADSERIQCIVSDTFSEESVSFGHTQKPLLGDYADGVDTIAFLLKI